MSLVIAERALIPPSESADRMPGGIALSATMHVLIGMLIVIGLPMLIHPPPPEEMPIAVQLVTLGPETRATHPNPRPRPNAKPDVPAAEAPVPKPLPKPEPPKPVPEPPPAAAAPPPSPPLPQVAALVPPPPQPPPPKPPELQALAPPPPPPKPPEPKPKPPKPAAAAEPKPEVKKTETPAAFDALLKNLTRQQTDPSEQAPPQPRRMRTALSEPSSQPRAPLGAQLTASELDLVRQQIAQCWNIPAGAREAQDLVIEIKVEVNSDATVRQARIIDTGRYAADNFFRAAADSALRAVLNPHCSPLRLPPDKYEAWRNLDLFFNPKDVL